MELAVRVVKIGGGRYRARVELGGTTVYALNGTYGSRGEARDAALGNLIRALRAGMAEHDEHGPDADDEAAEHDEHGGADGHADLEVDGA